MTRFTFQQIKTAAADEPLILNLEQLRIDKAHKEGIISEGKRERKFKAKQRDLNAPFAVYTGDPDYHVSRNPNSEPGKFIFAHKSILGKDERGRSKSRELKKHLRKPESGYERVFLPKDQYAHDEEMTKLAPNGLEAYKPKADNRATRSDSKALRKFHQIMDFASTMDKMRSRSSELHTLNSPEFEPTHPLNLLASRGGKAAIQKMFTDNMPFLPTDPSHDLCVCGRSSDKHVDTETAKAHHAKHGEHLEIHSYVPQFVNNGEGPIPGHEFRAAQSPLRHIGVQEKDIHGNTNAVIKRADEGMDGDYLPVVSVGTSPRKVERISVTEPFSADRGDKIPMLNDVRSIQKKKCPDCYNGRIIAYQRENSVHCDDCMPGKINSKLVTDKEGNTQFFPRYSQGLGGGKVRLLNEEHAPDCKVCNGNGSVSSKDKTGGDKQIPCRTCKSTGKDQSALSDVGVQCHNCGSSDSRIMLTPNNVCPTCSGSGNANPVVITRNDRNKLVKNSEVFEGNPSHFVPFEYKMHAANTGVDGWKGHGNPECTRCHGDDEYQTVDKKPCNCRIGSFDDPEHLISPTGVKYVHPTHIDAPERIYQDSMMNAYRGTGANPHIFRSLNKTVSPISGRTPQQEYKATGLGMDYRDETGRRIDEGKTTGVWEHGITIPKEKLDELNQKSAKNWSSVNAKFCASSADLEDVHHAFSDFLSFPLGIPGTRVPTPTRRISTESTYHPDVRPVVPKVKKALASLGDTDQDRYNSFVHDLFQEASHVAHDKKTTGKNESTHFDAYHESMNKLLSTVSRFHGDEGTKKVQEALTGLPKFETPRMEPVPEESK